MELTSAITKSTPRTLGPWLLKVALLRETKSAAMLEKVYTEEWLRSTLSTQKTLYQGRHCSYVSAELCELMGGTHTALPPHAGLHMPWGNEPSAVVFLLPSPS